MEGAIGHGVPTVERPIRDAVATVEGAVGHAVAAADGAADGLVGLGVAAHGATSCVWLDLSLTTPGCLTAVIFHMGRFHTKRKGRGERLCVTKPKTAAVGPSSGIIPGSLFSIRSKTFL
ncbi:MAG: hypothetical protein ACE5FB_00570 [Candidatus Binatia bacterium]